MSTITGAAAGLAILERLNLDYCNADQASDAVRFRRRGGNWARVSACAIAPGA